MKLSDPAFDETFQALATLMEVRAASSEPPVRIERHGLASRGNTNHGCLLVSTTTTQAGSNRLMT